MRILALDVGMKRIGVAVGEGAMRIAFPREILPVGNLTLEQQFNAILELCHREKATSVLVGYPAALSEAGTEQTEICREFADDLEDFFLARGLRIPVEFIDEGFSTQVAKRQLQESGMAKERQKELKDSLAAAAFLQTYLETKEVAE